MAARVKPVEKSEQLFYHSTSALAAVSISVDGFRLMSDMMRNWSGGALGSGIYITAALEMAQFYARVANSGVTLRVRMVSGTQILRLDGQYDQRVIEYLGREFSRELFSPNFVKAIPANKRLTRAELIHLVNFLWARGEARKPRSLQPWCDELGPLRRCLARCRYDGLGSVDSDIGVVIFNPSRLKVESILQLSGSDLSAEAAGKRCEPPVAVDADRLNLAQSAAEGLRDAVKRVYELRKEVAETDPASKNELALYIRAQLFCFLNEVPRWQRCLRSFCTRHQISMEDPVFASALREIEPAPQLRRTRRKADASTEQGQ